MNLTVRRALSGIVNGWKVGTRSKATKVSTATAEEVPVSMGAASEAVFKREDKYGAHNYHPLPVALCRAKGTTIKYFNLEDKLIFKIALKS